MALELYYTTYRIIQMCLSNLNKWSNNENVKEDTI